MNDFKECLAQSHRAEDWGGWAKIYKIAFPGMVSMTSHRQDGPHQRMGIDRSIILFNSKQILIDEKARFRNKITGKVYEDIALEHISDSIMQSPGWVEKPLMSDYIAYAILPLGICYMLPVLQLQIAWGKNRESWLKKYPNIRAQNAGYETLSCCIPAPVLFQNMGQCLRIEFESTEEIP